jgi:hypothetical protein
MKSITYINSEIAACYGELEFLQTRGTNGLESFLGPENKYDLQTGYDQWEGIDISLPEEPTIQTYFSRVLKPYYYVFLDFKRLSIHDQLSELFLRYYHQYRGGKKEEISSYWGEQRYRQEEDIHHECFIINSHTTYLIWKRTGENGSVLEVIFSDDRDLFESNGSWDDIHAVCKLHSVPTR